MEDDEDELDNEDEYDDGDSGGVLLSDLIGKDKTPKPATVSATTSAKATAHQKTKQREGEQHDTETENESESESESDEEQHDRLMQSIDKFYRSADPTTTPAKGKKGAQQIKKVHSLNTYTFSPPPAAAASGIASTSLQSGPESSFTSLSALDNSESSKATLTYDLLLNALGDTKGLSAVKKKVSEMKR